MKVTLHAICLVIAVALAPTLFAFLRIFGVKANIFLIYVIIAGFYATKREGIWLGLIFGLVYDIIVGRVIGLCGILYMLAGFFTVLICENLIRRSNALVIMLCTAVGTVIFEGISGLVRSFFSENIGFLYSLRVIGIEAVFNGVLAFLLCIPLSRIFRRVSADN